jgi:hypothetical protein
VGLFRNILWGIAKWGLRIIDSVWALISEVFGFRIFSLAFFKSWLGLFLLCTGFFIVGRLLLLYFKMAADDETLSKFDGRNIFKRLLIVSFLVIALPKAAEVALDFSIDFLNTIEYVTTGKTIVNGSESYVDISFFPNRTETSSAFITFKPSYLFVKNEAGEPVTDWDSSEFDINEKDSKTKTYSYFPDTTSIFGILVFGMFGAYLLILLGLQVIIRMFNIAFSLLIAPLPISSYVSEDDQMFSVWYKSIVSMIITTPAQFLFLVLIFSFCTSINRGEVAMKLLD